jgi:hypothetical protein
MKKVARRAAPEIISSSQNCGCSSVVEHLLAKEDVASSSLVTRSSLRLTLRNQPRTIRNVIAVHFENLLFLLLIAVALLFQLLTRAATKGKGNQAERTLPPSTPEVPPPIRRVSKESDAERTRKFLEALGQPPTSRPPPPVPPRTEIPPRPLAPVHPPTPHLPPEWKLIRRDVIQRESPAPGNAKPAEKIFPPIITGAPTFEVHEGPFPLEQPIVKAPAPAYAPPIPPVAKEETDIAILLTSKSGLRDAIIFREILGPPRGLRPLEIVI